VFKTWVVSVAIEPLAATHYSMLSNVLYTIRRTNREHSTRSMLQQLPRDERPIGPSAVVALGGTLVHSLSMQLKAVP